MFFIRYIISLFFLISYFILSSQDLILKDYIIENNDTILLTDIPSIEVLSFTDNKEKIKYRVLKRKVLKVYPYAIYTKNKLVEIEQDLKGISKNRKKKIYKRSF